MKQILNRPELPFCKGCGHNLIALNTARALEELGYDPLDVIVVTDIGCHGIIDGCLNTHTVHGLHGRSVALGAGISFCISGKAKKIVVFIGDGGSTIGLQHIAEAARLNFDMTVVVHNNMLYGMTGGQTSGLTPCGFRTNTSPSGNPWPGYDICRLANAAGSAYTSRIAGIGDISGELVNAFGRRGFSLVEIMEICPSYGVKLNPGRKLLEIMESSGLKPGRWECEREVSGTGKSTAGESLFGDLQPVQVDFGRGQEMNASVVISGSAGEGVQLAAGFFARAAVRSGYQIAQKGSYPVTVGVGFSTAELVISSEPLVFHGTGIPDYAIITSEDGLSHCRKLIERMDKGIILADSSLDVPETGGSVIKHDFRSIGPRYASLYALFLLSSLTGIVSTEALRRTVEESGTVKRLPVDQIIGNIS